MKHSTVCRIGTFLFIFLQIIWTVMLIFFGLNFFVYTVLLLTNILLSIHYYFKYKAALKIEELEKKPQ